jgi:hypothetical protein
MKLSSSRSAYVHHLVTLANHPFGRYISTPSPASIALNSHGNSPKYVQV